MGGKDHLLEIMQEIEIWPYYQMVHAQTRIHPGEWDTKKILWDFGIETHHLNLARRLKPSDNYEKRKRTHHLTDFVKIKESKKRDKYLDLAKEPMKLGNMQMMVIPTVIGTLGTVPKGLEKRLQELDIGWQIEIIWTTALLRLDRVLRWVRHLWWCNG